MSEFRKVVGAMAFGLFVIIGFFKLVQAPGALNVFIFLMSAASLMYYSGKERLYFQLSRFWDDWNFDLTNNVVFTLHVFAIFAFGYWVMLALR